jgi:endonuclease/exonuclease/phosphatase family metal-dependent hydrolase
MKEPVRIATYNIHSGVGTDAVYNIDRIINVLEEINPDIVAVQEVSTDPALCIDTDPVFMLRSRFGPFISAAASLIGSRGNYYGNLILSRFPIIKSSIADLSSHDREPRNVIDAEVMVYTMPLRLITTHMGLKYAERRSQVRKLVPLLERSPGKQTILLGDMNEWRRGSPVLKTINKFMSSPNSPASYLSSFPLFPLDRIWGRPAGIFSGPVKAHRSRLSRNASDHLPVYVDVKL